MVNIKEIDVQIVTQQVKGFILTTQEKEYLKKELEKMIPGFVDDRKFTDIVLNFYERGIRDGVQMMLERMTDIIAARNATHVSAQMSETSASGKLNDAFNEKNKED